ncbi:[FeFe] hydrogenase, group A [Desulfotomaculum arcticum]|uniref:[FeFe] hydrogenase, group A n=1 Tax=Desulfotruncus arcticus DSM 17038 TaxID=1121424 RepID=A0A1I2TYS6_9FIRM|nr:[FeFe] hydrogenase, group A [Desulfotruncus arcticus]SFG70040.1 [FeFe] hydrogenase, group A [Desulfotomaculum arcticum] [Desulfotruncus arcticus DSM 17038]
MEDQLKMDKKVTRRSFLRMMGGLGLAGVTASLAGCGAVSVAGQAGGEGWLPQQYQVPGTWPAQVRGRVPIDPDNPSIVRDDEKCVLCGQCLEVCKNTQTVFGYYGFPLVDETVCINCGQCALWCPTAAITERDDTQRVKKALDDPDTFVVVQTAPATRVALGEEFGLPPGTWVMGQQVAALRRLGFNAVFDTNFTADLTIMEEATELIKRIKGDIKKPLPQFTSCSPGWVKFCEYFYPDLLPHMSSCKSPQQMLGALAKTYYAKAANIKPEKIFSVAIMPCTAKKFEVTRPEMNSSGRYWENPALIDMDAVLTTRELARMIKQQNIDLTSLPEEKYDPLLGKSTGGAVIFGATGGVMEAAVRTAYFFITEKEPPANLLQLTPVRGLTGVKEAAVDVPGVGSVKVAVCHGMSNGRQILEAVRKGESPWHFVEFMSCPGGCISGGGQPRSAVPPSDQVRMQRINSLYQADAKMEWRESHENSEILALYQNFLQHPMSELAEELLHTKYVDRSKTYNQLAASAKAAGRV